jgi:hypothetical protein
MKDDTKPNAANREYAIAYAAHYTTRNLPAAIQLYKNLVAFHPDSVEAAYSRKQIQNIVNAVVSKEELLDAQVSLALLQFNREPPAAARRNTDVALAAKPLT